VELLVGLGLLLLLDLLATQRQHAVLDRDVDVLLIHARKLGGERQLFRCLDAKTYKVTLPKGIPQANFWSLTAYDNMTRSMLDTPQRYPRAGSQSYPSPAAEADADGSTTVYFGPTQPAGIKRGNWIQTTPGKGWFVILRLYSPLEPFFTKQWRPSEIVLVQ
jgi:hypothetical protein